MKQGHIMEALVESITQRIFEEWKHEGFILGFSTEHINFEVDDKEYVLLIREIQSGEDWSMMRIKNMLDEDCENDDLRRDY